jgi:hypothetical protein
VKNWYWFIIVPLLVASLVACGGENGVSVEAAKNIVALTIAEADEIDLVAGDVNVTVGEGEVDVEAGDVDVTVGEDGVDVEAGEVDVTVGEGGVDINAGGVDVNAGDGGVNVSTP